MLLLLLLVVVLAAVTLINEWYRKTNKQEITKS